MNISKKHKRKGRRRQSIIIGDLEKSSSEPDLTDYTSSINTTRWRKLEHEYISVDELKFYRRRKPAGILNDLHTRSNICLFDNNEQNLSYSDLKTEYNREYCDPKITLKLEKEIQLNANDKFEIASEKKSQYVTKENIKCQSPIVKSQDNLSLSGNFDFNPEYRSAFVAPNVKSTFETTPTDMSPLKKTENEFDNNKMDSQICHLKLEGKVDYMPEYSSQYIPYPLIERSHSIPQISSIKFQGDFIGLPEYRDSFKSYENIAKSAPIKKLDNICLSGIVDKKITGEYTEKYQQPNKSDMDKTKLLKTDDHLYVTGEFTKRLPEYNESYTNPNITNMPERVKPRSGFLTLQGNVEYTPEYRCSFLDFPRARPLTNKQRTHFKLTSNVDVIRNIDDDTKLVDIGIKSGRRGNRGSSRDLFKPNPLHIHDTTTNLENLTFLCQPEVRKAKKELLIKEHSPPRKEIPNFSSTGTIEKSISMSPDKSTVKSGNVSRRSSIKSRNASPTYKLLVENVDVPKGSFKKPTPKFGRRKSVDSGAGKDAHKLRNRSKIIEMNANYLKDNNSSNKNNKNIPSFIVLNEPCKQSSWMKPSWYDS